MLFSCFKTRGAQRFWWSSLAQRSNGSLKIWLKSLLEGLNFIEAWERYLSSRNLGWKLFQVNGVVKWVKGVETPPFIVLRGNLPVGVSETRTCLMWNRTSPRILFEIWSKAPDKSGAPRLSCWITVWSDMSDPRSGHIRKFPVESGEPVGQVRFGDIVTGENWLTGHARSMGWTYLTRLFGIRWRSLDKYGGLGILGFPDKSEQGAGHVRYRLLESVHMIKTESKYNSYGIELYE
jgi:hypothetical protein